jgi:hypothetical protein
MTAVGRNVVPIKSADGEKTIPDSSDVVVIIRSSYKPIGTVASRAVTSLKVCREATRPTLGQDAIPIMVFVLGTESAAGVVDDR